MGTASFLTSLRQFSYIPRLISAANSLAHLPTLAPQDSVIAFANLNLRVRGRGGRFN